MVSLRKKLVFSYALLIAILMVVSLWGVYHFVHLGRAVDTILVHNYKSILAAENMKEALERQDSSAMFFIAGHAEKARQQFATHVERFSEELRVVASNITEPGEEQLIADIRTKYSAYKQEIEGFLNPPKPTPSFEQSRFYFERLEPAFLALKFRLDDLLRLNQQAMVAASERATSQSWRAQVSTAALAAIALLFALFFAWRFTAYLIDPITALTGKAKRIAEGDFEQHLGINSQDEIGVLAAEFNRMAIRLRDLRQSDYWRILIEQKKSDAVIDSIFEPVIVTDARGRVTKLNRAATQLFGKSGNDSHEENIVALSGTSAGQSILQAVRDAVVMQRPVAVEGETALVPFKVGGAERSYRLRTTPMRDSEGRLLGAVSVLEDVTSIRELDRLKTEFVSVASNKLRTPLHSLQMALHTLIEGYTGDLSEKQQELLLSARQDSERLEELMGDLLELAEVESGTRQLSVEPVKPVELVRSAIEQHRASAECKHIRLEHTLSPDLPRVVADRRAVRRIFDNLLSNAIRHTERDGQVTISASERDSRVIFSVGDTGVGIPEEYLPTLFGRFVHVKGTASGGTGLGLALVKRLVETQGGQVGVESRIGEGTTFTFTLRVAEPIKEPA
jgi:two-component system, NtrC family, sensor histidine kinase KinB